MVCTDTQTHLEAVRTGRVAHQHMVRVINDAPGVRWRWGVKASGLLIGVRHQEVYVFVVGS